MTFFFSLGLKRLDARPGSLSPKKHPLHAWMHQNSHGKSSELPLVEGIAPHVNQVSQGFFFLTSFTALLCELKKPIGFTQN